MLYLYLIMSGMLALCLFAQYVDRAQGPSAATNEFGWYGVLGAAIIMAVVLVPMMIGARYPLLNIISGNLFVREFNWQFDVGRVLDQSTLHKHFFWFTVFAVSTLPYIIAARWMSDRRTRLGYWIPVVATVMLALCLLTILVVPSYMLFQYIDAMGVTPMRVVGAIYVFCCVAVSVGIVVWVAWPPAPGKGER